MLLICSLFSFVVGVFVLFLFIVVFVLLLFVVVVVVWCCFVVVVVLVLRFVCVFLVVVFVVAAAAAAAAAVLYVLLLLIVVVVVWGVFFFLGGGGGGAGQLGPCSFHSRSLPTRTHMYWVLTCTGCCITKLLFEKIEWHSNNQKTKQKRTKPESKKAGRQRKWTLCSGKQTPRLWEQEKWWSLNDHCLILVGIRFETQSRDSCET